MKQSLIYNVTLIDGTTESRGGILFDEKIRRIFKENDVLPEGDSLELIDGNEAWVFPGFIDPHVHLRTPGLEYKENLDSGSRAALKGGITTMCDMPNTIPPVFTYEIWNEKYSRIKKEASMNIRAFFGSDGHNISQILRAKEDPRYIGTKMYLNDTTGNLVIDESLWEEILKSAGHVSAHAESETFAKLVDKWLKCGSPCTMHLCHTTSAMEVGILRELKKDKNIGAKITAEVCPHHLLFTQHDVAQNSYLRMKPELAEGDDVEALWKGIADGTIDCFATDHAPHLPKEKEANPPAFGVPGVETLFSTMFTEWKKRSWDWKKFSSMMSHRSALIYGFSQKGCLQEGFDADLVLINPEGNHKISAKNLVSKSQWTPFEGYKASGEVLATYIKGDCRYLKKD